VLSLNAMSNNAMTGTPPSHFNQCLKCSEKEADFKIKNHEQKFWGGHCPTPRVLPSREGTPFPTVGRITSVGWQVTLCEPI